MLVVAEGELEGAALPELDGVWAEHPLTEVFLFTDGTEDPLDRMRVRAFVAQRPAILELDVDAGVGLSHRLGFPSVAAIRSRWRPSSSNRLSHRVRCSAIHCS